MTNGEPKDLSTGEGATAGRRWNWKWIVGAIGAAALVLWAVLFLLVGGDFYRTVDEVKAGGDQQNIRVGGSVAPDSLTQDQGVVRFALEGDGGGRLMVVYRGPYPDRLGPYEKVVVSGSKTGSGEFEATQVLVRCPDKLFPEKATEKVLTGTGLEKLLY